MTLPIDIQFPERVRLDGGAMFVRLPTLSSLEDFWGANQKWFPYSACGVAYGERQEYLQEYEWIFAPSRAAVVKAVMRWDTLGVTCEWYDWATHKPIVRAEFLEYIEEDRDKKIRSGKWTNAQEVEYKYLSSEEYTGWWRLANLPMGESGDDWLEFTKEIRDKSLSIEQVSALFQERIFESGRDYRMSAMGYQIEFYGANEIAEMIAYNQGERALGLDHYGCENDPSWTS